MELTKEQQKVVEKLNDVELEFIGNECIVTYKVKRRFNAMFVFIGESEKKHNNFIAVNDEEFKKYYNIAVVNTKNKS